MWRTPFHPRFGNTKRDKSISHAAIVRALKPTSAHDRECEISRRHRNTFKWILEPGPDSSGSPAHSQRPLTFLEWLRQGTGVFHIAGKPGSGK